MNYKLNWMNLEIKLNEYTEELNWANIEIKSKDYKN